MTTTKEEPMKLNNAQRLQIGGWATVELRNLSSKRIIKTYGGKTLTPIQITPGQWPPVSAVAGHFPELASKYPMVRALGAGAKIATRDPTTAFHKKERSRRNPQPGGFIR